MSTRNPTGDADREMILATLANELLRQGRPIKDIAKELGLSPSTLYHITNEKTNWPRASTIFPLAEALNLRLCLQERRPTAAKSRVSRTKSDRPLPLH